MACYGHDNVYTTFRETAPEAKFQKPSDLAALHHLETIQTTAMDSMRQLWVVRGFRAEKRTMTAVMEDDKKSYEETCSWNGKDQRQPIPDLKAAVHQIPTHDKWDQRIHNLPDTTPCFRICVL
jgi:hypothetical protein